VVPEGSWWCHTWH